MSWFSNTKFFSACCFQVELQCSPINSRKIALFHALQVSLQVPPRRRAPVNGEHALAVEPEPEPDRRLRHAGRFRALSSPSSPSPYRCTAVAALSIPRANLGLRGQVTVLREKHYTYLLIRPGQQRVTVVENNAFALPDSGRLARIARGPGAVASELVLLILTTPGRPDGTSISPGGRSWTWLSYWYRTR